MKRLFLLFILAAIPLFAQSAQFIYYDYGYGYDGYWHDEYWQDDYWCDGYWAYYPHGYYCVHFVWWYPWWWDWFWLRCHWCHTFSWDFFYSGFYIVWYDGGHWWYRPRYGRYVRHRLPYAYGEIRRRMKQRGYYLPDKPPREINIPYRENEVQRLMKQKDPEMFARLEQEQRSGNLERMRKQYVTKTQNEILRKNQEYGIKQEQQIYTRPTTQSRTERSRPEYQVRSNNQQDVHQTPAQTRIVKKNKGNTRDNRQPSRYNERRTEEKEATPKEKPKTPASKSAKPSESKKDQPTERYKKAPERPYTPQKAVEREKSDGPHKSKR